MNKKPPRIHHRAFIAFYVVALAIPGSILGNALFSFVAVGPSAFDPNQL